MPHEARRRPFKTTESIIAIGASTGGTEAIKEVLIRLPQYCPGVVNTQPAARERLAAFRDGSGPRIKPTQG